MYLVFFNLLSKIRSVDYREIWREIKEAVAGTERDFTEDSIGKAIFILSVPMVLEMIMESLFAAVDIFFVSKLGANAVATVGLTESVMTIVYSIAGGLSVATTALVSRRVGEKNNRDAGSVAFQAILLGFIVSVLVSIPGVIWAEEFLLLMGASAEMAVENFWYPAIIFGTNSIVMLLFIINAVFRSSGDAAISMRVIFFANIINMILDPIFIIGWGPIPAMGIKGAAIATSIGRGLAVIYQIYLITGGTHRIKLGIKDMHVKLTIMWELLRVSFGGIFQNLIATSSWIFLVRIIAVFGAATLAGYTIAIRIVIFAQLPAWGLSNSAATLVGQNLGAGHPERAEKSVWITSFINMIVMGLIGLILVIFPDWFIYLFIDDPEVVKEGIAALRIISIGFLFYGLSMVMVQAFNGSGDTVTPTIIYFFGFWCIEIPLAWIFAVVMKMELSGASIAIVIAESLVAIAALWLFRKGKWKLQKV